VGEVVKSGTMTVELHIDYDDGIEFEQVCKAVEQTLPGIRLIKSTRGKTAILNDITVCS
jgi:hypothetical protein